MAQYKERVKSHVNLIKLLDLCYKNKKDILDGRTMQALLTVTTRTCFLKFSILRCVHEDNVNLIAPQPAGELWRQSVYRRRPLRCESPADHRPSVGKRRAAKRHDHGPAPRLEGDLRLVVDRAGQPQHVASPAPAANNPALHRPNLG
jgi:hypothetical protein